MGRFDKVNSLAASKPEPNKEVVAEVSTPAPVKTEPDTQVGINPPSYHSTVIPTFDNAKGLSSIAAIHKAMREAPSAPASYRFSSTEKKRLEVIIFELKMRGIASPEAREIRTNENEIVRIALNALLNDYQASGDKSTLVKALESLRS